MCILFIHFSYQQQMFFCRAKTKLLVCDLVTLALLNLIGKSCLILLHLFVSPWHVCGSWHFHFAFSPTLMADLTCLDDTRKGGTATLFRVYCGPYLMTLECLLTDNVSPDPQGRHVHSELTWSYDRSEHEHSEVHRGIHLRILRAP